MSDNTAQAAFRQDEAADRKKSAEEKTKFLEKRIMIDRQLGRSRNGSWQFLRRNADLAFEDFAERIGTPRDRPARDQVLPLSARGTRSTFADWSAFRDDASLHPARTPRRHVARSSSSPASSTPRNLPCTESFKCIPDPRWKEIFSRSAKEFKKAVQLEKLYAQKMFAYKGEQVSRKRIELNTPRAAKGD